MMENSKTFKKCVELVLMTEPSDNIEKIFSEITKDFNEKYKDVYTQIDRRLRTNDLDEQNKLESVKKVINSIFKEDEYNWGRVIVAIFWARRIIQTKSSGEIVAKKIDRWVEENGGFDKGFSDFLNNQRNESCFFTPKNILFISLGLIAAITFLCN